MAARVFGDLSPDAISGSTQGLAVGIQKTILDQWYENKLHPLYPSVDATNPVLSFFYSLARYTPPTPLPWGSGGSGTLPTTGQLYP